MFQIFSLQIFVVGLCLECFVEERPQSSPSPSGRHTENRTRTTGDSGRCPPARNAPASAPR